MAKIFNYPIPNDLWVDKWDSNLTLECNYTGPDIINLVFEAGHLYDAGANVTGRNGDFVYTIDVTAADDNTNAALAFLATEYNPDQEYTFTDVTNHDGSTYEKRGNLQLHDYYQLTFWDEKPRIEAYLNDHKTDLEEEAESRLEYVKKYKRVYSFEAAEEAIIDSYISNVNSYIETLNSSYKWNFTETNLDEIPKIPSSIVLLFNQLPTL